MRRKSQSGLADGRSMRGLCASVFKSPKYETNRRPCFQKVFARPILRALVPGSMHGYGIASRLQQVSDDVLQVGESSLYPALQRLLPNGWVRAEWGASENNRRARFRRSDLCRGNGVGT